MEIRGLAAILITAEEAEILRPFMWDAAQTATFDAKTTLKRFAQMALLLTELNEMAAEVEAEAEKESHS